jgi:hypothetical protein
MQSKMKNKFHAISSSRSTAALALILSVLIAAAGPLSQTLRLVRVDPHTADYSLVFTGAWSEATQQFDTAPKSSDTNTKSPKPTQSFQALSGYFDTASAFQAPLADIPQQPLTAPTQVSVVSSPVCVALPVAESPPSFIPSSRGPPRA